ncbi:MAG: toll/interleukin-1 receptor domain-containing protein [Clostridiales bacterium]|nr:toll/interleukin-1 receptor domain-containing protein [Clostridiales bacterium]
MIAANLKCKNCGADLDVSTAVGGVVNCTYCGSVFTVSESSDEVKKAIEFAENCLDVCEFDKAFSSFRKASELGPKEPEAYFGMALASHRIQYLRDYRKDNGLQPICHEINDKKFSSDANYLKTLTLATPEQRKAYGDKAAEIDRIKSEFNKLKAAGVDYDCFLCVKVTDDDSDRHTEDSHIAEKIYHSLKEAGYAPFYSEYDLRGQTGADYEARILYALFVSESMFLICTDESYLQTPWVKNEYTRFIGMMSDEQKERESLTVVFKDKPIEKIPGLGGRIQGISMNSFDALQRILSHVEAFQVQTAPELTRKKYSGKSHAKRTAVRQTIAKRSLTALGGSAEITVSDKSMLKNATAFLERGNFEAAINFADILIKNNPSNSAAYRLRFLAENECRTADEYIARRVYTPSFDSLEKSIASADETQKKELYTLLFRKVQKTDDVDAYNEFVSLPDSTEKDVSALTKQMFALALKKMSENAFDSAIKTVSDTDEYIRRNIEFARAVPDKAVKYYKNVLEVDEGNGEALWHAFVADNGIKDLFAFFSKQDNFQKTEDALYGYGYNEYASEKLFEACMSGFDAATAEACALADFLLSLIPKSKSKEFKERLVMCRNKLMRIGKPNYAKRYNDRIIAEDKMDDEAHFYACLINRGYSNPLSILRLGANALNDPEFRAAFDIYPDKHPDKDNPYIDVYAFITENEKLMKFEQAFERAEKELYVDLFELKNCARQVADFYLNTAKCIYNNCLENHNCLKKEGDENDYRYTLINDVFELREDVSNDPMWKEALVFANAYGACTDNYDFSKELNDIINNQAAAAAKNIESDKKAAAKRRRNAAIKIPLLTIVYIWAISTPITSTLALAGIDFGVAIWGDNVNAIFGFLFICGILSIIFLIPWAVYRRSPEQKAANAAKTMLNASIIFASITTFIGLIYIVS